MYTFFIIYIIYIYLFIFIYVIVRSCRFMSADCVMLSLAQHFLKKNTFIFALLNFVLKLQLYLEEFFAGINLSWVR